MVDSYRMALAVTKQLINYKDGLVNLLSRIFSGSATGYGYYPNLCLLFSWISEYMAS